MEAVSLVGREAGIGARDVFMTSIVLRARIGSGVASAGSRPLRNPFWLTSPFRTVSARRNSSAARRRRWVEEGE
jgi:hypothetical protein